MTNTKFVSGLIAIAMMAGATHALAQDNKPAGAPNDLIGRLDSDGDNRMSLDEYLAGEKAKFQKLDADGNGTVTIAEIDASLAAKFERERNRMLNLHDFNGDGAISNREHKFVGRQKFTRLDKDNNGLVARHELPGGKD